MNLKKAVEYFKNRRNKNSVNVNELYPDCADVTIKDKRLAVTIGQWLGEIPNAIKTTGNGFCSISSITADEYMARKRVKEEELEIVRKRFANILKMVGFGKGNDCTLSNFDDDLLAFDCVFNNTGEVAHMELSFGDGFEYSNEIEINFDDIVQTYSYFHRHDENDNQIDVLMLDHLSKKTECGNTFRRHISPYTYYASVEEGKYTISLEISYPEEVSSTYPENEYIDEEKMEELLTMADVPAEIVDLYYGIKKCLKKPIGEYGINIKATRKDKVDDKEITTVTDALRCHGKTVHEFTINKNGRIITVKPNGVWSYDSLEWKISQHNFDRISYEMKDTVANEQKLGEMPSPKEAYMEAKEEAEQVRKFVKALVK